MALKSIVSVFGGMEHEASALEAALEIAQANVARLRIVHVSTPAQIFAGFYDEAAMLGDVWRESVERQNREQLDRARELATTLCKKHGVPLDGKHASTKHPSAVFVPIERSLKSSLAREISLCDLIIIGRDRNATEIADESAAGVALFATGRPVLFVPDAGSAGASGRIWRDQTAGIAWNGSPEAIRAVVNASALLEATETVHVLMAHDHGRAPELDGESLLMEYLTAHGAKADLTSIDRGEASAAAAILHKARELGCDFLVMGAYGHSVFREMLLGGFTAEVLEDADLALVLSH